MHVRSVGFRLAAITLVGAVAIGFLGWRQAQTSVSSSPTSSDAPSVRSMEGTVPDGSLGAWKADSHAEAAGPLALGELRRMFDYYLSAVGEKSMEAITQEISAEIERSLAPASVPRAKRIFGLYIAFKRELLDLERRPGISGPGVQAIRNRLMAMQDLRAQYFNAEETQAMFGFEDAYDMDAVARLEISQDPSLSAQQKQDNLNVLDATLSPELLREREAPRAILRVEEKVAAVRAKGASDEAQWKRRIAQYRAARSQLMESSSTADGPSPEKALLNLQRELFTEEERRRLPAYDL